MRIYDLTDDQGRVFAFEIPNSMLGRRGVCRVARTIPGVTILSAPRLFSGGDVFCEFSVAGQLFEAWEPYGDSSRYGIGPEPPRWCPQVEEVRAAFVRHTPVLTALRRLVGHHR